MKTFYAVTAVIVLSVLALPVASAADEFVSSFPDKIERPWAGPEFWTNPMEDWRISGGRLEVVRGGGNRNVQVLTRQLGERKGTLEMSVVIGRADGGKSPRSAGFRVGIQSELGDYRSAVFFGRGLDVGITAGGLLFIGNSTKGKAGASIGEAESVELRLTAEPAPDQYQLKLTATKPGADQPMAEIQDRGLLPGRLIRILARPTTSIAAKPHKGTPGPHSIGWIGHSSYIARILLSESM